MAENQENQGEDKNSLHRSRSLENVSQVFVKLLPILDHSRHFEEFEHFEKFVETTESGDSSEVVDGKGGLVNNQRERQNGNEVNDEPEFQVIPKDFLSAVDKHV